MSHQVPFLINGAGRSPDKGGCIMQVVDWMHSQGWTDRPKCVHPVLRSMSIAANDSLFDDQRGMLLDLTGRLMNTSTISRKVSLDLAIFMVDRMLSTYSRIDPKLVALARKAVEDVRDDRNWKRHETTFLAIQLKESGAAKDVCGGIINLCRATAVAPIERTDIFDDFVAGVAGFATSVIYYCHEDQEDEGVVGIEIYELLVAVLDEYDRLTGRTDTTEIADEQWEAVCAAMSPASA